MMKLDMRPIHTFIDFTLRANSELRVCALYTKFCGQLIKMPCFSIISCDLFLNSLHCGFAMALI